MLEGVAAEPEASIRFSTPIPLKRLGRALDVIRDGSTQYTLTKVIRVSHLHGTEFTIDP